VAGAVKAIHGYWSRVLVLGLACSFSALQGAPIRKKLIETGWDMPDTQRLRANLAQMEQRPFDGVVVEAVGHVDEKKRCPLSPSFVNAPWQREWFRPCLEDLRACQFRRFTDNFVLTGANPGNVDWFDDTGWRNIVEHWRIAAWLAKQGGLKGILFDPEPYTEPFSQFKYSAQSQHDRHTFDEYCAKTRERGRAVMSALTEEYPDLVLFCYFGHSVNARAATQTDPRTALAQDGYGLLPAFLDGWLDAAPPTATIVDGCEGAYLYNSVAQYLEAAVQIKGPCQNLVASENRARYRAQVQVGFGIYLDAYWNPPTSPWHIDGKGGSGADRLRENVMTALRVADEYVWVYGEKFRWWPTPNGSVKAQSWADALAGSEAALGFARDPAGYARDQMGRLRTDGKLIDLVKNGDFTVGGEAGPARWSSWQQDKSTGSFRWDRETGAASRGAARASQVADGCFIQAVAVKPSEHHAVQAVRRLQGQGEAWIRIRWQTAEGKWMLEGQDQMIHCAGPRDQWSELFGVVTVPEGVGKLVILLGARDQRSPEDMAWYDDVHLYRLE
jgi:hypothetical protein